MNAWKDNIRKVIPYVPGEQPKQPGIVKLNTNENPYPPAPGVATALESFDPESLRLYPDPDTKVLAQALADYYETGYDNVFVGVGSDDVLAIAFMSFFNSDKPILFPDISYSFYSVWADLFRIPYEKVKLDAEYRINPRDYDRENGGIIFPNPNAPTGICEPIPLIRDILENNKDVVVIVDEAYIDFGGESALTLVDEFENLLIVQTFSKSRSMAGIRIGYAIGSKTLIDALKNVKFSFNSYTLNRFSLDIGIEALKDREYFEDNLKSIIHTREETVKELEKRGFILMDSRANFLFATHRKYQAKDLFMYLKKNNVYVRHFDLPRIENYLRITIGTDEQMKKLFEVLDCYL